MVAPVNAFEPDSPQLAQLVRDTRDNPPNGRADGWTRHLAIGRGALAALPAILGEAFPGKTPVLVADHDTWEAAGPASEAALIAAGLSPRRLILAPREGDDHLVCEDGVIRALAAILAAEPEAVAVAVGAGTVNDIAKHASHQLGRDYLAVPTAASMNGYTSTIAAVLVGGVKRTLPSRQPRAIVADIDVLAAAPAHLNRAGFGDLLSKPVSQGDWLLSHFVRGVPYDEAPNAIIDALFARLLDEAAAIGRAEPAGLRTLMEAILVSGYSMALAGSSAPASGGEHLVSHYWDMEQLTANAPLLGLHGTQVGVATRLSARLFERMLRLDADAIDPAAAARRRPEPTALDAAFASLHPRLDAATVAEIHAQLSRKQRHGQALEAELAAVKAAWPTIVARIRASFIGVERLDRALREAGCVTRAAEMGCDLARLTHTLIVSRQIRDRYVAFDLLDDLGLLEGWAVEVAQEIERE
jgi:glycerol-1-phosphate dehydrogenase [NAD(P)+]